MHEFLTGATGYIPADGVLDTAAAYDADLAAAGAATVVQFVDALRGNDTPLIYAAGTLVLGDTGSYARLAASA